jgi:hypothetical protein
MRCIGLLTDSRKRMWTWYGTEAASFLYRRSTTAFIIPLSVGRLREAG